jgi:hypothetical protein
MKEEEIKMFEKVNKRNEQRNNGKYQSPFY